VETTLSHCSNCGVKLDWGTTSTQTAAPVDRVHLEGPPQKGISESSKTQTKNVQKGSNPWLIAFVAVLILIAAIVIFDLIM
jgi:hypothetical protein